jgi:hypothetical protein
MYLVGKCSTLVDRLCITALLPERHGGFGSPHVIIIDGGNQSDIYQCVNFARQYGLDIENILRRIIVSRAFTIYQLVGLITNELPKVVRRFDTKALIIRDMLHMFIDSQIRIDEARPLINEITNSLRIFSKDMSVIVSLSRVPSPQYYKMLFPCFDRCIQIYDRSNLSSDNNNQIVEVTIPIDRVEIVENRKGENIASTRHYTFSS